MTEEKTIQIEQAVVQLFNLDGWDLEWVGGMSYYDAKGFTPKGSPCVMEIKYRKKYYQTKLIEVDKYVRLLDEDVVALYFVIDPKGNYLFWLNNLDKPEPDELRCPATTMWKQDWKDKQVYLLDEKDASIINYNF